MAEEQENNAVGYKRPPAHARFRPGRSGNPSGRPKRLPSFPAVLLAELAVSMPGNDPTRAGSKLEALVRTLVDGAIAGDARTQSLLVGLLARIGETEANEEVLLSTEDREILDDYVGGEVKRRTDEPHATPPSGSHED
jgi:hypothetical protein